MRIISSFRDYYDSASGWDEEATPVYLRESEVSAVDGSLYWSAYWGRRDEVRVLGDDGAGVALHYLGNLIERGDVHYDEFSEVEYLFVGFCGLIAPAWRWDGRVWWNLRRLVTELAARGPRGMRDACGCLVDRRRLDPNDYPDALSATWPPHHAEAARTIEVFRALDCPVFLVERPDRTQLVRNPRLVDLDFQRIVDPFSARQAVETYLGNELAKDLNPPQPISDEDMRDMKGFDGRSFKTPPGGPTRKRKKKRKG